MEIRDKFLSILNEAPIDSVTSRYTNKYYRSCDGKEKAIENYANGKIDEAGFMLAMRKAGYGETKSKEALKTAKEKRENIDLKKKREAKEKAERKERYYAKMPSAHGKSDKEVETELGRELGKILLPPTGWRG